MPAPWMKAALWSVVLLTASARVQAEWAGQADDRSSALCGKDQLTGQYECVKSAPLSDEEVRVNMAYLASFRSGHARVGDDKAWGFAAGNTGSPAFAGKGQVAAARR